MAAAIQGHAPEADVELIKGGGGNFIVIADGVELWNKRAMGDEFPANEAILKLLTAGG